MTLEQIRSPHDLKKLDIAELSSLSEEIRTFLIEKISETGGHLASNLGVVELTIALHKVYDSSKDKIIWDVGHQAYIHKILTGRHNQFDALRQLDGLSGFPKSRESIHDAFDVGHSSTAISVALGFCAARDIVKDNYGVCAVVGDGSMTGGLVYEALNNAGRASSDMLVILNDNQMSIAKNVGAVSRHLNDIRTAPIYREAKKDVQKFLGNIPHLGKRMEKLIETAKDAVKFILVPGVIFEEMGFQYFGPIDGHNLKDLIRTLEKLRTIKGPVFLHVVTKKGKGYPPAEQYPNAFHGVESFFIDTGKPKNASNGDTYTSVFGQTMLKLAKKVDKLAAITAAMPDGTGLAPFQKAYPDRFYDVGIAESHAVTFAAGLAKGGVIPVVSIYSSFLQRAYDQILHDICIQNLHVILAIDRAGLVGADGETHQGLFDYSFLAHMPNMTIMAPKNQHELVDMLTYAVCIHKGPIALRYPRGSAGKTPEDHRMPIKYGRSETIVKGKDIAIVSVGTMIDASLFAVNELQSLGYNPSLYNARFVKPMDEYLLDHLLSYRYIFILEDNVQTGGYGECLWAKMAVSGKSLSLLPCVHFFAFPDKFIEQGTQKELFCRYKLDGEGVLKRMLQILDKKSQSLKN